MPRIREVVRRSGHKALRVWFPEDTTEEVQLQELRCFEAFYERASRRLVAIDVEPSGNYRAVCDQLWEWEQAGHLIYETGAT